MPIIGDRELCQTVAAFAGHSEDDADNCENCELECPGCPWLEQD